MKKTILCVFAACCLAVFLMVLPFLLFVLALGGMSENTVVKTVETPDGAYFAQVIDNNQGALGGATLVEVYENKKVWGRYKKVERVYSGKWGESHTMEIYWKDEYCLVINSVEYPIDIG